MSPYSRMAPVASYPPSLTYEGSLSLIALESLGSSLSLSVFPRILCFPWNLRFASDAGFKRSFLTPPNFTSSHL